MGQPVVHFEIGCKDKPRTEAFYSKLFGWSITSAGPASMIDTASKTGIAGHMTALGHEPFRYTIFYVQVDDVQKSIDEAVSLGGKMLVPPVNIPGGTFGWIGDPEGNTVGLWKPACA